MRSFPYLFLVPCILICLSAGHNVVMTSKWKYEIPITISASLVDGSTDFADMPYYINLSALPTHFWNNVKAGGEDIRLWTAPFPGGTELPHHVMSFTDSGSSGTGTLFTKRTIDDAATTMIYLRYGNPSATAPAAGDANGQYAVWSSLRQGFALTETTTSTTVNSLVSGGFTLTTSGSGISEADGKLEKKVPQGSTSIATGGATQSLSTNLTLVGWMWRDAFVSSNTYEMYGMTQSGNNYWNYRPWSSTATSFAARTTVSNNATATAAIIGSGDDDTWVHLALSKSSTTVAMYKNGSSVSMSDAVTHSTVTGTANTMRVGVLSGTDNIRWDVVWEFSSVLVANHILALYRNQNTPNTYHTVGIPRSLWKPQIVN